MRLRLDRIWVRRFVDTSLPRLARWYRLARDTYRATRYRPEPTGAGFSILRGSEYANRIASAELAAFNRHVGTADLFVDIGANVGFFTVLASRAGVRTLAIEPSPVNLRHLYENLRIAKGDATVEVLPVALSHSIGLMDLYGSGQGASLQRGWGDIASNFRTLVPTTTVDSVLSGRPGRMLIKVDVEGSENDVLAGAAETLIRSPRPTWLIEHGPDVREGYREFFEQLWMHSYTISALPEAGGRAEFRIEAETVAAWGSMEQAPELMFLCQPLPEKRDRGTARTRVDDGIGSQ
jgi:FkbM family methyltransferase